MTDKPTLLPCPFCGGPVKLEKTITKGAGGRDWWGVVCRNTMGLGGTCAIQQRPSASVEAAATRWNTRTTASPITSDADGEAVTLAECPIGLFWSEYGTLCLKTEYGNNEGRVDAYIIESGEFFWGRAPQTIPSQRASLVVPIDTDFANAAITAQPDTELVEENERLRDWLAETQMLAHKWMVAHDRLHAGKPYDLPKPADLPDAIAALRDLRTHPKIAGCRPLSGGSLRTIFDRVDALLLERGEPK